VDTIEHGTFMDDEGMKLMKERGTFFVPTVSAGRWVFDQAQDPNFFPPIVRPKALLVGPQIQNTFAKAYKSGVKILFGTDTGVGKHGDNAREFKLMVEAGMAPMETIRVATSAPAKFLELDHLTGSIAVGKLGELVGVPGNPLEDITAMERVVFVMKDNTVYKAP
jgi:imidazolonepropionase-like amidohydrolase